MSQHFPIPAFLLSLALAAPVKLLRHAHALGNHQTPASTSAKETYNKSLSEFLESATTTAPPTPVLTETALAKTCVYINNTPLVPLPTVCAPILRELLACSEVDSPPARCFEIIGATARE